MPTLINKTERKPFKRPPGTGKNRAFLLATGCFAQSAACAFLKDCFPSYASSGPIRLTPLSVANAAGGDRFELDNEVQV
jgi:hypothetical protein